MIYTMFASRRKKGEKDVFALSIPSFPSTSRSRLGSTREWLAALPARPPAAFVQWFAPGRR